MALRARRSNENRFWQTFSKSFFRILLHLNISSQNVLILKFQNLAVKWKLSFTRSFLYSDRQISMLQITGNLPIFWEVCFSIFCNTLYRKSYLNKFRLNKPTFPKHFFGLFFRNKVIINVNPVQRFYHYFLRGARVVWLTISRYSGFFQSVFSYPSLHQKFLKQQ